MATENVFATVSFEAGEDLSSDQYRFVILSSGKVVRPNAATDKPIGILQNAPESGQAASVALLGCGGISKVVLGATLAENALVAVEYNSAADAGKAKAAASTQYPAGLVVTGGDEDELGSVLLTPLTVIA